MQREKIPKSNKANLGDIAGSVPDQCNKVNIAVKSHEFFGFRGHVKVMFTLYYSLLTVQ